MGIEIERKFLVKDGSWLTNDAKKIQIKQGYLKNSIESAVRIRIADKKGFITVKGSKNINNSSNLSTYKKINTLSRLEFEYEIPIQDALDMLILCENNLVEKIRYFVSFMGFEWSVDLFEGDNSGLVLAEIELQAENQTFIKPSWIGIEVSNDSRYLNSNLAKNSFKNW